jgi:hypothetical protein
MNPWLIISIVGFFLLDTFLFTLIFRLFFKEKGSFKESLWYLIKPELFSIIDGDFWDDIASETRFKFFIGVCLIIIIGELYILRQIGLL